MSLCFGDKVGDGRLYFGREARMSRKNRHLEGVGSFNSSHGLPFSGHIGPPVSLLDIMGDSRIIV